jgi:hypothetical protein
MSVTIDLSYLVDVVLLMGISAFLLVKALLFRRQGALGTRLAQSNVSLAAAFIGALLAPFLLFYQTGLWRYGIRFTIFLTLALAMREMVGAFGGWCALGDEILLALADWWHWYLAQPWRVKIAILYGVAVYGALILLAEWHVIS